MSQSSSIYRLPPDAREALDDWLRDPAVTQLEAVMRVNALLAESHPGHPPVSKSAISRYHQSIRGLDRWRKDAREIAAQAGHGTADAAREAGRAMGRLIASRLPAKVRMHCVAALVAELARADRPRQLKEPK